MTSSVIDIPELSPGDATAFRTSFADPHERIVLVILSGGKEERLRTLVRAVRRIRAKGSRLKLVLYGDSSAILAERDGFGADGIGFLETWAQRLLPSVASVADAVIALGEMPEQGGALGKTAAMLPEGSELEIAGFVADLLNPDDGTPNRHPTDPRPSGSRVALGKYILQNDWGIGDELLLSAVAREIIRSYPSTHIWIRSRHGFRFPSYVRRDAPPADARAIETIYQNPTLYGPGSHSPFPGHLVEQMLGKFTLDTGLMVRAVDLGPELDFKAPETRPARSVILHTRPNPRLPSKDWGIPRWERLSGILTEAGVHVRQVGGKDERLLPDAEDLRGVPPGELPELFAGSGAVVCVVGFLMHLAKATRTPAVVIYGGREHPSIDGYPEQVHLSSEPLPCRGRWGCHLAPDLDCPHGMKCMEHITPELVANEVMSLLGRRSAR